MILIQPFKSAEEKVGLLKKNFPFDYEILESVEDIEDMYSDEREQYRVEGYVKMCSEIGEKENAITLGVTDVDLYSKKLNFVFGSAQVEGYGCVISTHRLGEGRILEERMMKEAVHEVGHVKGLHHCDRSGCVMHFSNSLSDTDTKDAWFCQDCESRLKRRIHQEMDRPD